MVKSPSVVAVSDCYSSDSRKAVLRKIEIVTRGEEDKATPRDFA